MKAKREHTIRCRITALALSGVMALSLLPAPVLAADVSGVQPLELNDAIPGVARVAEGQCGEYVPENVTWGLYSDGRLVFEGSGPMKDMWYSASPRPWDGYNITVEEIILQSGITNIPPEIFYKSTAKKVSIPATVRSIGYSAFNGCANLNDVVIPEGVTSIEHDAFAGCGALANISLPDSLVEIEEDAFSNIGWIRTQVPGPLYLDGYLLGYKWDKPVGRLEVLPGTLGIADGAFGPDSTWTGCTELTEVTLPQGLRFIGSSAFQLASSLGTINLPDSLETIGNYAFANTGLKSVVVPEKVTVIEQGTFRECASLEKVQLPKGLLELRDGAFQGCTALKTVKLPEKVKTLSASLFADSGLERISIHSDGWIKSKAFGNCAQLKEITFEYPPLSIAGDAFIGVTATAYYKNTLDSWEKSGMMQDYGGHLTWVGYGKEELPADKPLPAPTVKIWTDDGSGRPTLSWDAVNGAKEYEIWRKVGSDGKWYRQYTTTKTSYTNTSAYPGSTYYYQVRALDASGKNGVYSAVKSITCDCARPGVTATVKNGLPYLTWQSIKGAKSYEIWRSTNGGEFYRQYTTTSTHYTNTSAKSGNTYTYKIKALCAKSKYGDGAFSYTDTILKAPTVRISTSASSGRPTLSWNALSGASKYEIWRKAGSNGKWQRQYTTTRTSYTNTTAEPGVTYYYQVRGIAAEGTKGVLCTVKSITCDCARPGVNATTRNGLPYLTWQSIKGAKGYEIWRSTDGGEFYRQYTTTHTYYTNTSAKPGHTYSYKIRALCAKSSYGNGAFSYVDTVTVK